jgi:hypothetical protein
MAPVRAEQVRGRPVSSMFPWGSTDPTLFASFRDGWDTGVGRHLSIPTTGRTSSVHTTEVISGDGEAVAFDGQDSTTVPAGGADISNPTKGALINYPTLFQLPCMHIYNRH